MIRKEIISEKKTLIILFVYSFLLLFFCSKMSPLYPFNEWDDINLYFTIGKGLFNGKIVYSELFDHKGPLIFFIYGIAYLISNTTFFGMYIIEALMWAFMICAGYFTAKLYIDKIYAFIVALIYPLFTLPHILEGGSAEEMILVFATISLFFFLSHFKDNSKTHKPLIMLIHGIMCAATILIKINLVVFWFFPLVAVFINLIIGKNYKNLFQNILAYIVGLLILFLPIIVYFLYNNALSDAWNTYIVLNSKYARFNANEMIELVIVRFYQRIRFEPLTYFFIYTGSFYFPIKYIRNTLYKASIILAFFAVHIIISMTFLFMYYYTIPYYIFSLLGGIAIVDIIRKFLKLQPKWYFYILFFVLAIGIGIREKNFFSLSKAEILRKKEPNNPVFLFSNIVMKESKPTLLNLGLDLGSGVFTKANIVPNVKYFISPNLPHSIYPEMRDEQTKYIENKEVQFIILSQFSLNFDYFFNLPALNENYKIVDTYIEDKFKTYYLYKLKD